MMPAMGDRPRIRVRAWGQRLASALLMLALCSLARADQPEVTSLLKSLGLMGYPAGTMPPHFSAHTVDDGQLSMAELRGKVAIVNFWAGWCIECRSEMPVLERLHRELSARGLAIIGINSRESKDAVKSYAKELGLTFRLVVDPDGRIAALYGVIGLPTTFVFGRDGRAVALAIGPREWGSTEARVLLQALLAEPTPPSEAR